MRIVLMELLKAAGHKYLRRIPTGKPKPRYRYIYAKRSKHHDSEFHGGEKIRLTHGEQVGHYEVTATRGDFVTLKHDETGHEVSVHKDRLSQMFRDQHHKAKGGAPVKAKKAHDASKGAQKAGTATAHAAAARLHNEAADAGAEHAALHRELATAHTRAAAAIDGRERAKLASAREKFVLRIERQPRPGYLGTKQQAWDKLMSTLRQGPPGDFTAADARYLDWKRGKANKPPPYAGGELDAVNDALGLYAPDRGERLRGKKDPRVSSLREGFEKLTVGIKRWDDPRFRHVLEALRGVAGLEKLTLPEGATKTAKRKIDKEQEAYYREQKELEAQGVDSSFDPDEVEANPQFDDSFDFGFNVAAEART